MGGQTQAVISLPSSFECQGGGGRTSSQTHDQGKRGQTGNLNSDKFARALLNYRNTPLKDIGLSPAQIIFARNIRDHIPHDPRQYKPRQEWILDQKRREELLRRRYEILGERLKLGTKCLAKLEPGNIVSIQNQAGPRAKKWDKTGVIVEVLKNDQYRVKVDGSGRVTLRNWQFLRKLGQGDLNTDSMGIPALGANTGKNKAPGHDDSMGIPAQGGNTGNTKITSAPTQPLDTLEQVGAARAEGVIAEYGTATAATAQYKTRGSYSDVLKCGLNPHHFK